MTTIFPQQNIAAEGSSTSSSPIGGIFGGAFARCRSLRSLPSLNERTLSSGKRGVRDGRAAADDLKSLVPGKTLGVFARSQQIVGVTSPDPAAASGI